MSVLTEYPCGAVKNNCTSIVQIFSPGRYLLEVWGASGGVVTPGYERGKGGYSKGVLTLKKAEKLFFFIGAEGGVSTTGAIGTTTAFNGGGSASKYSLHTFVGGGGGATDIRIGSDSLDKRVIVAGGGGGTGLYNIFAKGGDAGGENGENGWQGKEGDAFKSGGIGGKQTSTSGTELGVGGSHPSGSLNACGGGGGWYGGGFGEGFAAGGGGGSGFVYTKANSLVQLSTDYILTQTKMNFINETFTSPYGVPEKGHIGNGAIRVTLLQKNRLSCRYKQLNNCLIISLFLLSVFSY